MCKLGHAYTQSTFARILQDVQKSTVSILHMSQLTWKPTYTRLQGKMQELEKSFSTLLHSALAGSGSFYSKAYNIQVLLPSMVAIYVHAQL